jgi:hypothetical protein
VVVSTEGPAPGPAEPFGPLSGWNAGQDGRPAARSMESIFELDVRREPRDVGRPPPVRRPEEPFADEPALDAVDRDVHLVLDHGPQGEDLNNI